MSDNKDRILTVFRPAFKCEAFFGASYIFWNKQTQTLEFFSNKKAVLIFIFWLIYYMLLIYFTYPRRDENHLVAYTKRHVSNGIEYTITSGLLLGLVYISFYRDIIKRSQVPFYLALEEADDAFDKFGFSPIKHVNEIFTFCQFALKITSATLTCLGYSLLIFTSIRKSLVVKFIVGVLLLNLAGTTATGTFYLHHRLNTLIKLLQNYKGITLCDGGDFCRQHLIMMVSLLHAMLYKISILLNRTIPTFASLVLAYFELVGECLFILTSLFNIHENELEVTIINVLMVSSIFPLFLTFCIIVDNIHEKSKQLVLLMHRVDLKTPKCLRTRNMVEELLRYSQWAQDDVLAVYLFGDIIGPSLVLEYLHSMFIFCSLIVTFKYVI